jgi:hypothetical protein
VTADLFGDDDDLGAEQACHELLVRLAGRLPDAVLWRLRDWLAASSHAALSATLSRELLRHRVGITDEECELLLAAVGEWGASRRLLDAVLPVEAPDEPAAIFTPITSEVDVAALSVLAVVRDHPGCLELSQTGRAGNGRDRDQRVVLVRGGDRPWVLAGTLQRLLRAHGDRTPCVEVLPPHGDPPAYHRAAIIASTPLWRRAAAPVGAAD